MGRGGSTPSAAFAAAVPTDYLPALGAADTIYVAGPPGLVEAVKTRARDAQAQCYADPFLPGSQKLSLADRLVQMWRRPAEQPAMSAPGEARQTLGETDEAQPRRHRRRGRSRR